MFLKGRWVSLIAITLVYWLNYSSYEGMRLFIAIPAPWGSIAVFMLLPVVAAIGYFGLMNSKNKWVISLWKLLYAAAIIIVFGTGAFIMIAKPESQNLLEFVNGLRMFFTSPVPFGVLLFFGSLQKTSS